MEQDGLRHFSDAVRRWFGDAFAVPTHVQAQAWDEIAAGHNALVVAPTGSGKTLAAFLFAIDKLMGEKAEAERSAAKAAKAANATAKASKAKAAKGVRVLYVSPLKALGADVERNLAVPLEGISQLIRGDIGTVPMSPTPEIRVAMRTGDTTADQRRKLLRNPPDILITTPESLYLMLTSQARETLRTVDTVIVDEIHSLAGNKRGAHLSLSLERLDDLLEKPAQRIGLSATVKPVETVAHFLGGVHPVKVVTDNERPDFDIAVNVPVRDMTNIPIFQGVDGVADSRSGIASIWPYIEGAILDQVLSHKSTIVFVNSRGLCERLTARLNELYAKRCAAEGDSEGESDGKPLFPIATTAIRSDIGGTTTLTLGAEALIAKAHHGSVAKEQRLEVERELKRGELPCVVATSSLELGIDMGDVDLVLQVAPPPSVSSGLQRIGRANHQVGGSSQGIVFPKTRTEIIDATVVVEGMHEGRIERTVLQSNALDVLAQQTVAAVASSEDGLAIDTWFDTVRRSACYDELSRTAFDSVIWMLAGGYNSADLAEFSPRLNFDPETGKLEARPNAQRLAVTGSGTIPDRGMFPAMLPEGGSTKGRRRVGELDEEMVYESRVGDIIILGTNTWRIAEIGRDRVIVEPAPGRSARLPFWHGELVGRPYDMGVLRGEFLHELDRAVEAESLYGEGAGDRVPCSGSPRSAETSTGRSRSLRNLRADPIPRSSVEEIVSSASGCTDELMEDSRSAGLKERLVDAGLNENARNNLMALAKAQKASTGIIPDGNHLVVEQCADESGAWNVVLHSPFGKRVHAPWALAVSLRIREELGYDPQAMAADDGIVLQIPPTEAEMPGADFFVFDPEELEALVRSNVSSTALFAARFRECAARALLMSPTSPGKRAPLWQQRLKGGQLLEAVRSEPGFPIMAEAARECLTDAYDMPSLRAVMEDIDAGRKSVADARTQVPSPLAAAMLFGYVAEHLYEGDLPHAEGRASMLSVDPTLLGEILGTGDVEALVDAEVEREVEAELQMLADGRKAKGADGIADMLRRLGPLSVDEIADRLAVYEGEDAAKLAPNMLGVLEDSHRAFPVTIGGREVWASVSDGPWLKDALGVPCDFGDMGTVPMSPIPGPDVGTLARNPLDELVLRYVRTHARASEDEVAKRFGLGAAVVREPFARLAQAGRLQRFGAEGAWVAPEVLTRLRKRSLAKMQSESEPVTPDAFSRFVLDRQMIAAVSPEPLQGIDGVAQVLAQFEGVLLPAALWEDVVLPDRVADYAPSMLDELLGEGEVIWVGSKGKAGLQIAFYPTDSPLCPVVGEDADWRNDPATLHRLVEGSEVTNESFAYVRAGAYAQKGGAAWGDSLGQQVPRRAMSRRSRGRYSSARNAMKRQAAERAASNSSLSVALSGRWRIVKPAPIDDTLRALALADSLIDRYGVVSRDVALATGLDGGLSSVYPVLRSMLDAGELIRGEFVDELGPSQFASRETVEELRGEPESEMGDIGTVPMSPPMVHEAAADADDGAIPILCVLPASDPACVFGSILPWPKLTGTRHPDNLVVLANGAPILFAGHKLKSLVPFTEDAEFLDAAVGALVDSITLKAKQRGSAASRQKLIVKEIDGIPALESDFCEVLANHGFVRTPDGMRLYVNPF